MDKNLKKKWLLQGGLGASLFGLGLCCTIESAFLKHAGVVWYYWLSAGTISIAVTILGLVLLIKTGNLENQLKK
ncbi:MAG: hypothetical protein AAGD88_07265 [Bacteroidota bacterium]